MEEPARRPEINKTIDAVEFGVVSTLENGVIKSRAMHFAVDDNLNFYLASLKGDPKVKQLLENTAASLLIVKSVEGFMQAEEIEVIGAAELLSDAQERKRAFELLAPRSPVVANMQQGGALDMLAAIRIKPQTVKYRAVPEILRGVGPTVLDFDRQEKNSHYYFGWESVKQNIASWITELRAPFLSASVIPVILGAAIAWKRLNVFDPFAFLLTMLGVALLHAGTNMGNDYFDHRRGNDEANTEFVRPFSGGSRMIQKGLIPPQQVLLAALFCFALGSAIGLYFTFTLGPVILLLGLVGVFSGFFYSAPPLRLADRGLGEAVVGINFGALAALGAYFVQAQQLSFEPVLAALPVSFLIAAVLYINEFPDYTADKAVGKDNLVVRLGKEKAVGGYVMLMGLVFVSTLIAAGFGLISPFALLLFLTLPRALRAVRLARLNFNQTLYLIPANADTILSHLYGGILISLGYVLDKLLLG